MLLFGPFAWFLFLGYLGRATFFRSPEDCFRHVPSLCALTLLFRRIPFLLRLGGVKLCNWVSAISRAFSLTPGTGPFDQAFCWRDSHQCSNRIFVYRDFMSCLNSFLSCQGINPSGFGTHSFRRGGASFALEAGVSIDSIAVMGDWKSDALLGDWKSDALYLYLHMPISQRLQAQHSMASHILSSS